MKAVAPPTSTGLRAIVAPTAAAASAERAALGLVEFRQSS